MRTPDWQLPCGVTRELSDYLGDESLAAQYEGSLANVPLTRADLAFTLRHFAMPGRVLDLGCGTGRLLLEAAGRGAWCVGIDLAEPMLRVLGRKAAAAGMTIHRVKANIADLSCIAGGSFDQAACLFSTLGMVSGLQAREAVLGHVRRVLRPRGRFILHVHNRLANLATAAGRRWLAGNAVGALLGKATLGDRAMPPHAGGTGFTLHLFTKGEALSQLRKTGFRVLEVEPVGMHPPQPASRPQFIYAQGYLIAAERLNR